MAKHTNASKKFFKKPNKFRSDTKPNNKGNLFGNTHVQKAEASTTDDFFLKPGAESVKTSSKSEHSDRIKKGNSFFNQDEIASYSGRKNQFGSQKNTDSHTSKTFVRGPRNQLFHKKSQINQQQNKEAKVLKKSDYSSVSSRRLAQDEHNITPQTKSWQNQRTDKSTSLIRNGRKEKNDFSTDTGQSDTRGNNHVSKKPFDKKKYRLQKYSKKYKLQQWEDRRKTAIMHEYYKTVSKDDEKGFDVEKIYQESEMQEADEENDNNVNSGITGGHKPSISGGTDSNTVKQIIQGPKAKKKPFKKVQEEFKRIKEEKIAKREEFLKKKAEKEEARKKYKKEKVERYKKLSRRTKKGQPIMSDRIEMLLEKMIQKNLQD